MVETIQTGWVTPPIPIRGLDHLGVQAPCIALYGQLLPGITNVTDRARYYSFYPWLLWSFERRYTDHSKDAFCRVLRRAECLLGLIASYHETDLGEDDGTHGTGTIGRRKLQSPGALAVDGQATNLEEFAAFEGERSYFKNRLGGLGQYYFGSLRDLRILDYADNDRRQPPGYDRKRGETLAQALDQAVPADRFFEVLDNGNVGPRELADLVAFCPCSLTSNEAELQQLLDIFLARTKEWKDEGGADRRATLAILLDLVDRHEASPDISLERSLRAASYSQSLANGEAWHVHETWQRTRDGWGVYARNEMLSVALQGLFWAQLRGIEERGGEIRSTAEAGSLLQDLVMTELGSQWTGLTVEAAVERLRDSLPPLSDWSATSHEIQRTWKLHASAHNHESSSEVAREAAMILLSLLARGLSEDPYKDFAIDPGYFSSEDIHLSSLQQEAVRWLKWNIEDWIAWLGREWGIDRHLHVALRKLRYESRDTFRIRPLDESLTLVEVPDVAFTSPRIACASQILSDLGLVIQRGSWYELSDSGRAELEACRHG